MPQGPEGPAGPCGRGSRDVGAVCLVLKSLSLPRFDSESREGAGLKAGAWLCVLAGMAGGQARLQRPAWRCLRGCRMCRVPAA